MKKDTITKINLIKEYLDNKADITKKGAIFDLLKTSVHGRKLIAREIGKLTSHP